MSENCCKVEGSDALGPRCPSCGAGGKHVGAGTVPALLREPLGADAARDGYRFCSGGDCDVVYFHAGDKARFLRSDLTVSVWQKESGLRPLEEAARAGAGSGRRDYRRACVTTRHSPRLV